VDLASRRFTWLYAQSQLRLKYRYTSLGFLWNLLEPALYLAVLSFVFSVVNRMSMSDYAVFLFAGLIPWRYFEKVVATCMDSIVQGDWLLRKLPVSPFALPLTRWAVASAEFGFSFLVTLLLLAFLKRGWSRHCLILPLAALPWSLFALGLGLICATLFTFFRDIRPIVQMGLLFVFFSAPILYRPQLFAGRTLQASLLAWHPMTYFAALFQKPIYWQCWPGPLDWAVALGCAAVSLLAGWAFMSRAKSRFYFFL
jgi:homopolymeric O-antigen transport system permease protein